MTAGAPGPSIVERVYRLLLRLLPSEFRADFGDAMRGDVAFARSQSAAFWWREIGGLLRAVAREHVDALRQDVTYALRMMRRTPGFTLVAVLMLAAGTGANAGVFSVIDAAIVRPGFPDADRVVEINVVRPNGHVAYSLTMPEWDRVSHASVFAALTPVTGRIAIANVNGDLRRMYIECVAAAVTDVTGVPPALGRSFSADEDQHAAPVVVIGHALWQQAFGGRVDVLGSTLTLDGRPLTVIGVMPRGYLGVWASSTTEAWAPVGPVNNGPALGACAGGLPRKTMSAYGRIRAPHTAAQAAGALDALHLIDGRVRLPASYASSYDDFRGPMMALSGVAICVLLIACANVANLQLERFAGRRREIAVRLALGASRYRVIRQSLVETLLLTAAGAAAGLVAARATLAGIASMMPPTMPNVNDLVISSRVLWLSIGATLIGGLAIGLLPAWQATQSRSQSTMGLSARGLPSGAFWTRRLLVIVEVALSVTLVIGAGLMVRTYLTLQSGALGFEPSRRFTARTLLEGGWVPSSAHRQFVSDTIRQLSSLPGVRRASVSSYMPLSGYTAQATVTFDGRTEPVKAWAGAITPHFLEDLGATLAAGRSFTDDDSVGSPAVAIVNETFADEYFPDGAIGRLVRMRSDLDDRDLAPAPRTIVGVVRDMREGGRDRIQRPEIYAPHAQESGPALLYFLLALDGPPDPRLPALIKSAVRDVRPGQTIENVETLDTTVERAFARPRFGAWLFAMFGGLAVALAALGLGAVIAWWVRERRRELAIRVALGARPINAVSIVMKEAIGLTMIGATVGAAVAATGTRLMSAWLYGVAPTDASTFAGAGIGLLIVAIAAAALPARRAARVDPAVTLRTE